MSTEPDYRLAKVCWADSRGVSGRWQELDDIKEHGICHVWSVGWLIADTDEYIQLCPHIGHDPDQGCGEMTIPKAAVVSIEFDNVVSIREGVA